MKDFVEWLERTRTAQSEQLKHLTYRVLLPGTEPVGFSNTVIKIEPVDIAPPRPGSTDPTTISLLHFSDTEPLSYNSLLTALEIGSVLALAADRRIEVAQELATSVEGHPPGEVHFLPFGSVLDRRSRGPIPADLRETFVDLAQRFPSLAPKDLDVLGAATGLHYGALLLCEHEIRSAYLLLVAGLEVLSRSYGDPPTSWSHWERSARWDELFGSAGLSEEQATHIRQELMQDRQLRLKATFRNYVSSRVPASFWTTSWQDWIPSIQIGRGGAAWGKQTQRERPMTSIIPDSATLHLALGKTYDLRSAAVHRGSELQLVDVGIKAGDPVCPDQPVPYALLRFILRTLIRVELRERSEPNELPDIRYR